MMEASGARIMKSLVSSLRGFLARFHPWPVSVTEFLFMRLIVVYVLWEWCPSTTFAGYAEQPLPTGLARFFDLTWMAEVSKVQAVLWCVRVSIVVYALAGVWQWCLRRRSAEDRPLDWLSPLSLLVAVFCQILVQTNRNSIGATHHGYLAMSQTVLVVALCHLGVLIKGLRGQRRPKDERLSWEAWISYMAIVVLAAAYVIAGVTKLHKEGLTWIRDAPQVATHMARTQEETYYDHLDPAAKGQLEPFIQWVARHPHLTRVGLGGALVLEALAFLALAGRRWALVLGICIEAMHFAIGVSMKLFFPLNQWLVFAFWINAPGLIRDWWTARAQSRTGRAGGSPA